jgi:hypothetical protein
VLLRCLKKADAERVLEELHDGPTGGHFAGETTAHKILREGYYWPTLFRDAHMHMLENEKFVNLVLEKRKGQPFHCNQ